MTQGFVDRWKERRAEKKQRLAGMSPGRRIGRRVGILGTWFLAVTAVLTVIAVVLVYTLSRVPRPEELSVDQVGTIAFSDGSAIARVGNQNRTIVALNKVPEHVRWAVIATEDRDFYSSPGVSVRGTLRAAWNNVRGGDTQGGSGIAQQYVKNAYLTHERTLSRKLRELAIAVKLSREYSKDQILEYYLNIVYFGRGAYGIAAAADVFFGKPVEKLSVAEGALLAGMLRSPHYYDPANNPGPAAERYRYVIDSMVEIGKLNATAAAKLAKPPATVKVADGGTLGAKGENHFIVERVKDELAALPDPISETDILTKGLKIITTIDKQAQQAALEAVKETFADLTPEQVGLKNALVAVNPANGGVLAYYGGPNGKGYDGKPNTFDWAGLGWRPPGSSFKPFTLAAALDLNVRNQGQVKYQIDSRIDGSMRRTIGGTVINNSPGLEFCSGPSVTLRRAMECSLNTAFDGLAYDIGPENVAKLAWAAGIPKKRPDGTPVLQKDGFTGFSIGIGDYEVRPIDMAIGFATLANGGVARTPHFVQKVIDSNGKVIYQHKDSPRRAMDPKVANDTTLTMMTIADFSSRGLADGRPNAMKTGTKGIEDGEFAGQNSDAWTVGFVPQVSAAVWVGSGSNKPVYSAGGGQEYGRDLPGLAWKLFMDKYLSGKPVLPMPTQKQIFEGTNVWTPTPTTSSSTPPSSSTSTTPTTSSSSSTPPTMPSSPSPEPEPTTAEPSPTCTPRLLQPCPRSGGETSAEPSPSPSGVAGTAG